MYTKKSFRAGMAAVAAAMAVAVVGGWTEAGAQGCDYDSTKMGNFSRKNVISAPTNVTYNDATVRCVFIKGMPPKDNANTTFLNTNSDSIKINGLSGKQFHYENDVLNNSPKWDGGYYIYIPASNYIEIKGALTGDPACTNPVTYTITFNPNGGTITTATSTTRPDSTLASLPTPSRTGGYNFYGWFTVAAATGGDSVLLSRKYTKNDTIYARWKKKQFTVTYNSNGATATAPTAVTRDTGETITLPVAMVWTGNTFGGWNTSKDGTGTNYAAGANYTVTKNDTLYAKWTAVTTTYRVTVTAGTGATGGGDYAAGATVNITAGTPPTDQRFKNWTVTTGGVTLANANNATTSFTMPANAVTVTAVFEAIPVNPTTYLVTVTNGTGGGSYAAGATVSITAGTPPANQQFKNWTTTSNGVTFADANKSTTSFTMPANAVTVTATFEATPVNPTGFLITFDPDGGSVTPTSARTGADGKLTANPPTPTTTSGYSFVRWERADGSAVSTSTVFSAAETITARWAPPAPPGATVKANTLTMDADVDSSTSNGVGLKLYVKGQNADGLTSNGSDKPNVDSVGIWYKRNGAEWTEAALSGNALVKGACAGADSLMRFALSTLKTGTGGTISFKASKVTNPSGDVFYFAIAPRWSGGGIADSIARPLFVYAITVPPPKVSSIDNPVKLEISQADRRKNVITVIVKDTGTGGFDPLAAEVSIVASLASNMSNPMPPKTVTVAEVSKAGGYNYTIENNVFAGEEQRVYFECFVSGDGVSSQANKTNFLAGRRPPTQVSNLSASAGQSGSVDLSWSTPTATGNGLGDLTKARIRIYYSDKEIAADADTSKLTFVREIPANTNTANKAENVPGLTLNRDYWFAVVLIDVVDGNPAATLRSPAAACKGNTGSGSVVVNIFEITAAAFNDTAMAFTATVKLTAAGQANYKYGYFVLLGADTTVKAAEKDLAVTSVGNTFQITTAAVGGELMFDTAYTFHVYLIDGAARSRSVFADVKTGGFKSQKVVVKKDSTGSFDNGKFKVGTAGWGLAELDPCTTTVTASNNPADNLISDRGFIPIGAYGYSYKVASKDLPVLGVSDKKFSISMLASEDIPFPYTGSDARLYRWSGQYWEVLHDTRYDSTTGYFTGTALGNVRAESDNGSYVYRLMISERGPGLPQPLGSHNEDVAADNGNIDKRYSITCNVGNFKAYMLSGPAIGLDSGAVLPSSEAIDDPGYGETRALTFSIPGSVVENSASSGILAFLVVTDGRYSDTNNVSHRVISPDYYGFRAEDETQYKWRPFAAQVELTNRGVKRVLGRRYYQDYEDGADFETYDTLFRLFRWHETADNRDAKEKWVEYNGKNDGDFDMNPGRLMWFRTSDEADPLNFGDAKTVSLKNAFRIALPPNQWTDFVLPFQFNVCLGDILDSTTALDPAVTPRTALEVYRWTIPANNKSKQQYATDKLFDADPRAADSSELRGGSNPFTVFNNSKDTVYMRIPPRPAFMSRYRKANRRAKPPALAKSPVGLAKSGAGQDASGVWYYTLRAGTADADLPNVFVGYSAVERAFAVPPSFGSASMALIDGNGAEMGHHVGPAVAGGGTYRLRFYNDGRQKTVFTFSAQPSDNAPFGSRVTFVKASTGEMLGARGFEQSITVSAMSSEDVFMLIGGSNYRAKAAATTAGAKFTVAPIRVNMAARSARIAYFVPESGVERVEVAIYDIKGRLAWKNSQTATAAAWNTMEWNGRSGRAGASAGLYFVRVRALGSGGMVKGVSGKRLTFAR